MQVDESEYSSQPVGQSSQTAPFYTYSWDWQVVQIFGSEQTLQPVGQTTSQIAPFSTYPGD
jgi:hypothetical protein